ncbi:hypothetical protein GCM10023225_00300 [Kineococcus glutinatus]|uniref:Fibronectin type-III domain-containing protein n=1 Tax=Kineococcus glutinatus TaxID=1070872 RepID=A0ABP9H368_9ACTN
MSADVLPTVQVNGVVWAQTVVGNTVYATGEFTSARPAGAPAGTGEVPRRNILAYDVRTGALIPSWAPTLNAKGLVVTASPDGRRIYVGGNFTEVSGTTHNRVVALDAATGAVVTSFRAGVNYRVRAIAAVGSTVYIGGAFASANNRARARLAAFRASDGGLLDWAPSADQEVFAMVAPAGGGKLVVGGRFATLNGQQNRGTGALDLTSGATLPWPANATVYDYGPDAAVYSLSTDGTRVFGTGYKFGGTGNLENAFAADAATGNLLWVNGCAGDTYSSSPLGGVLYTVGHAHNCSMIGGHPETDPRTFQRAQAFTVSPPAGQRNSHGTFAGRPAAQILQWLPDPAVGTYTGQNQAAWSVAAGGSYVVLGGEFPTVNGTRQQGLVRFAVRPVAPNDQGPREAVATPTLTSPGPGRVTATVRAGWDRDDRTLRYELLRAGTSANPVATASVNSAWWDRPTVALTDPAAPAGAQTYRVRVRDAWGNVVTSPAATIAVAAAAAPGAPAVEAPAVEAPALEAPVVAPPAPGATRPPAAARPHNPWRGRVSPVVGASRRPFAPFGGEARFSEGLVVEVTRTEPVWLAGRGPGEVAGPGVAVVVELRNRSADPVDLAGITVNAAQRDGRPADASDAAPASRPTGVLQPGATASGTWAFGVARRGEALSLEITSVSSADVVRIR